MKRKLRKINYDTNNAKRLHELLITRGPLCISQISMELLIPINEVYDLMQQQPDFERISIPEIGPLFIARDPNKEEFAKEVLRQKNIIEQAFEILEKAFPSYQRCYHLGQSTTENLLRNRLDMVVSRLVELGSLPPEITSIRTNHIGITSMLLRAFRGKKSNLIDALCDPSILTDDNYDVIDEELIKMDRRDIKAIRHWGEVALSKRPRDMLDSFRLPPLQAQRPLCFVSYCNQDKHFVGQLTRDLQALGANVWVDHEIIQPGDQIPEAVAKGIADSHVFLVVLTLFSVKSKWVSLELDTAIMRNRKRGKPKIIPGILGRCDVPELLRSFKSIDLKSDYKSSILKIVEILDNIDSEFA